jgi:hypothetical protein
MLVLGRYALGDEIARGGIASVHLGLVLGDAGFSRPVAIKRLLPAMVNDPDLAAAFLDEARLASRVRHPNVVSTIDVREQDGELFLVLEYVHGESLAGLVAAASAAGERIPISIVSAIVGGALRGLHAAHEAKDELGNALGIIHRDVTPQNILVGTDGAARVIDFGIAKAASRGQITREGQVKGKLGYLAPEQLGQKSGRTTDVYGAGVCLWEALTGQRAFDGASESAILAKVMAGLVGRPSKHAPEIPPELDRVVLRALDRDPDKRFATAEAMAEAVEAVALPAPRGDVCAFVERLAAKKLAERAERIAKLLADREALAGGAEKVAAPTNLPAEAVPPAAARPASIRRRGAWILAVAALALFGFIGAWALNRSGEARSNPPLPEPVATAPVVAVRTTAEVTTASEVATAASDAPLALDDLPLASAEATAKPPSHENPQREARGAATGRRSAPAKPRCDPPYSIDRDGVRRYKKECLE